MSSLSVMPPTNCLAEHGAWRGRVGAAGVALALHAGVLGLLLHGWTPALETAGVPEVMRTQLVSLPPPVEQAAPPVAAEPPPAEPVVEAAEAPVEPQARQLEQAELAFKRAEQQRLEAERVKREQARERREQAERERQERLREERLAQQAQARAEAQAQARAEAERQAEAAAAERAGRDAEALASRRYLPIEKKAPAYPARALDRGLEGSCTVAYAVNAQGRIEHPRALDDCHPLFVQPSLTAARSFRYRPRIIDGRAVAVPEVRNTFHYRIQ